MAVDHAQSNDLRTLAGQVTAKVATATPAAAKNLAGAANDLMRAAAMAYEMEDRDGAAGAAFEGVEALRDCARLLSELFLTFDAAGSETSSRIARRIHSVLDRHGLAPEA